MTWSRFLQTSCLVVFCWLLVGTGLEAAPIHDGSLPLSPEELSLSVSSLVGLGVVICAVVILVGCVCCPHSGLKVLSHQNGIALPHHGVVNQIETTSVSEFTIFPPPNAIIKQPVGNQHPDELVTFEPLPDIRLRKFSNSLVHPPRPAHFSATINRGLSLHDWFEDPRQNFPRSQLQYQSEVGTGWFGKVVEGEAQNILPSQKTTRVIVKILREDASPSEHVYFLHEVRPFRDLKHPNIVGLFGRCLESDPFLIILEHCAADLKSFLIERRSNAESILQSGILLNMACNISSALQHMHHYEFIHTDLASRNCLVDQNLCVKIGDYGTAVNTFKEDYYCVGDIALPIRWCAPESLLCTETAIETKEVTRDANMWSFGVLLWELLELGKMPYMEMSDDEVLLKVVVDHSVQLEQPKTPCAHKNQLYQIMKLCWNAPGDRPSMKNITTLLNHLYDNKDVPSDSAAFESRWNSLQPVVREHNVVGHTVDPLGVAMTFESNFSGDGQQKRDSFLSASSDLSSSREISSSRCSLTASLDMNFAHNISPSLQNLRGSLEDLDAKCRSEEPASEQKSKDGQMEDRSIEQQITAAIQDLDNFLAGEVTSSETSKDATPERNASEESEPNSGSAVTLTDIGDDELGMATPTALDELAADSEEIQSTSQEMQEQQIKVTILDQDKNSATPETTEECGEAIAELAAVSLPTNSGGDVMLFNEQPAASDLWEECVVSATTSNSSVVDALTEPIHVITDNTQVQFLNSSSLEFVGEYSVGGNCDVKVDPLMFSGASVKDSEEEKSHGVPLDEYVSTSVDVPVSSGARLSTISSTSPRTPTDMLEGCSVPHTPTNTGSSIPAIVVHDPSPPLIRFDNGDGFQEDLDVFQPREPGTLCNFRFVLDETELSTGARAIDEQSGSKTSDVSNFCDQLTSTPTKHSPEIRISEEMLYDTSPVHSQSFSSISYVTADETPAKETCFYETCFSNIDAAQLSSNGDDSFGGVQLLACLKEDTIQAVSKDESENDHLSFVNRIGESCSTLKTLTEFNDTSILPTESLLPAADQQTATDSEGENILAKTGMQIEDSGYSEIMDHFLTGENIAVEFSFVASEIENILNDEKDDLNFEFNFPRKKIVKNDLLLNESVEDHVVSNNKTEHVNSTRSQNSVEENESSHDTVAFHLKDLIDVENTEGTLNLPAVETLTESGEWKFNNLPNNEDLYSSIYSVLQSGDLSGSNLLTSKDTLIFQEKDLCNLATSNENHILFNSTNNGTSTSNDNSITTTNHQDDDDDDVKEAIFHSEDMIKENCVIAGLKYKELDRLTHFAPFISNKDAVLNCSDNGRVNFDHNIGQQSLTYSDEVKVGACSESNSENDTVALDNVNVDFVEDKIFNNVSCLLPNVESKSLEDLTVPFEKLEVISNCGLIVNDKSAQQLTSDTILTVLSFNSTNQSNVERQVDGKKLYSNEKEFFTSSEDFLEIGSPDAITKDFAEDCTFSSGTNRRVEYDLDDILKELDEIGDGHQYKNVSDGKHTASPSSIDDSGKYSSVSEDEDVIYEDLDTGIKEIVNSTGKEYLDEEVLVVDTETNEAMLFDSGYNMYDSSSTLLSTNYISDILAGPLDIIMEEAEDISDRSTPVKRRSPLMTVSTDSSPTPSNMTEDSLSQAAPTLPLNDARHGLVLEGDEYLAGNDDAEDEEESWHKKDDGLRADAYTPDFESETDDTSSTGTSCSSTSGSFECIHSQSNSKEEEDEEEEEGDEIVSSIWDKSATPTKSAIKSPEKTNDMKKSVSFHEEDPLIVYSYPPDVSDDEDATEFTWHVDYSSYADWDFQPFDDEIPEDIIEFEDFEMDTSPANQQTAPLSTMMYSITGISDEDLDSLDTSTSECAGKLSSMQKEEEELSIKLMDRKCISPYEELSDGTVLSSIPLTPDDRAVEALNSAMAQNPYLFIHATKEAVSGVMDTWLEEERGNESGHDFRESIDDILRSSVKELKSSGDAGRTAEAKPKKARDVSIEVVQPIESQT